MREIKFRAWDKLKQRMLPVTLMDFSDWWISCKPVIPESKEPLEYGERNSFRNEESDRHVLMQYTGFKDIKEKEIFEGDIVYLEDTIDIRSEPIEGVVEFIEGAWWVVDEESKTAEKLWGEGNYIRIKGNIHENVETLDS